jgi:hypothetical protein
MPMINIIGTYETPAEWALFKNKLMGKIQPGFPEFEQFLNHICRALC